MTAETRYILAMSCVLPALVGGCLYRKMQPQYHLLIYMMLMDAVTETIDFIGIKIPLFAQAANLWINAYMMISLALFLRFTQRNEYITKKLSGILLMVAVALFIYNFYKEGSPLQHFYSLSLFYMFGVKLFIATNILSKQATVVNIKLTRNFWFWAGCLFIVQNAYGFFVFGIYYFGLSKMPGNEMIGLLTTAVNVFYYCLFAIVLLLVPKKNPHFIHQYPKVSS
jgi:hypothetical protein